MTAETARMLVAKALAARPDEPSCGDCDTAVARFAELTLAGRDAAAALPLVEEHLRACGCCREDYEALMAALREAERSDGPPRSWWRRWIGARG